MPANNIHIITQFPEALELINVTTSTGNMLERNFILLPSDWTHIDTYKFVLNDIGTYTISSWVQQADQTDVDSTPGLELGEDDEVKQYITIID